MKNRYALFLQVILFLSFHNVFSQGEWIRIPSPTSLRLGEIFCTDSLNCWAAGDSGVIIHTTNGGSDWEIQSSGVSEVIQDIFFLNNDLGWALSTTISFPYGTYILKTTNGGAVWDKEFFKDENIFLHAVYFLDSLNGWIGGSPTAFYGTADGGLTWNIPEFDSSLFSAMPVRSFNFYSPQYGFATGGGHDLVGVIWRTTNYGQTWLAVPMGPEPLQELYLIDSMNIVGVGGDFEFGTGIARTTDGGDNWVYEQPGFFGIAFGLSFRTDYEAWSCLGFMQKFIFSNDSGKTWIMRETVDSSSLYDIVFTDSLHGFAVGDSGEYSDSTVHNSVILKYKTHYISSFAEDDINLPSDYFLFQNYPNPFNPSTKINYQLPFVDYVRLKVYDVLGKEVAILVNGVKAAGTYTVNFYGGSLASGIYFYKLNAGDFVEIKKMVLLR